jgi:apoptosis-inducing factor 2
VYSLLSQVNYSFEIFNHRHLEHVIDRNISGCVIQGEVISIDVDRIVVHGHRDPLYFDYLVIATGSSYAFPGKIVNIDMSKVIQLYSHIRERIQQAKRILIVGGGSVGVELAAEIATDFSEKTITIVHSQATLLQPNVFHTTFYSRLHEKLEMLRIKIILNDRLDLSIEKINLGAVNYIEGQRTFITEQSKQSIDADLTFVCIGAHVNNKSLLNGSLKSKINSRTGRLLVNNYLQVEGLSNVFAIGDISDKEAQYAYLASKQGTYVARIIPMIEQNKSYPTEYRLHSNPTILLTIGRYAGIGQLPISRGLVIGSSVRCMSTDRSNVFACVYSRRFSGETY